MDLTQLRYFLKVAELRSFTKAAEALHIAQPAVTRQVRLLEEELGVQLLLRHSKGAEPTEAGTSLQMGASAMLRLAEDVRSQVLASTSEVVGSLRIGFPMSVGATVIAKVAVRFHQAHPAVHLQFLEGHTIRMCDELLGDRLDMAVLTQPAPNPLLDMQFLYEEPLWVVFGADSKAGKTFRGRDVTLQELGRHALIQLIGANSISSLIEERARQKKMSLNVSVESDSTSILKSLLLAGQGMHVSPLTAFLGELQRGELAGKPLKDTCVSRYIARRIDRPSTAAQAAFLSMLSEEVALLEKTLKDTTGF